jgi:hypothetical protein
MYCANGYVYDANGCQTCQCIKDPIICPAIACAADCSYEKYYDTRGCPTCTCNPCPKIACTRICEHGYQNDPKTGCPVCLCNEKPTDCYLYVKVDATANSTGTGTTTTAATTSTTASLTFKEVCSLDCVNGYYKDDRGCDTCYCLKDEDVCTCKPTDYIPIKCKDGSVTYLYEPCTKNPVDGNCYLQERKCPIVIIIEFPASLTKEELQKIYDGILRYSGTVAEKDVTLTEEIQKNGTVKYTISYERDSLPASDASGVPIAERLSKDETVASKGGVVFVENDSIIGGNGSPNTSFASLLVVPFLGALISLLNC